MSPVEELRCAVSAEEWARAGQLISALQPDGLNQDDTRMYWLLATRLQLQAGDTEGALRSWKVVSAVPGAWRNLDHLQAGLVFHKLGKQSEAMTQFQEALQLAPEEGGPAYESLGEIFHAQGRPPHITVPWFENAALCYQRMGLRAEMERACRKGLALDQANRNLKELLGL